jgi:predicted RNase H-like nuclease
VLLASSHTEASALSRAAGSVGVSIQTWNIVPRIREAAGLRDGRLVEVHPELSFRMLTRDPLPSKRTAAGRSARLAALRGWLPDLEVPSPRPGRAAVDDCLDALVCAWTGLRWLSGDAEVLGGDLDPTGQVMRIVI